MKTKKDQDFAEDLMTRLTNKFIKLKNKSRISIDLLLSVFRFYLTRGSFSGRLINLTNFENTPYFGQERVDYLSKISKVSVSAFLECTIIGIFSSIDASM